MNKFSLIKYRYGKALQKLRDENIAIIGSGMSFHNMRVIRSIMYSNDHGTAPNLEFEKIFVDAMKSEENERRAKFGAWESWEGRSTTMFLPKIDEIQAHRKLM